MTINLSYIDTSSPNPSLWLDQDSLGLDPTNYAVSPVDPSYIPKKGDWFKVNEFCSVLAADWLTGDRPGAWGASNYAGNKLKDAAGQLISFSSLDDQVNYAAGRIGGTKAVSVDAVAGQVASGIAPAGTMIWAGSDEHVVAAYIDGGKTFLLYDPNNGKSQTTNRTDFGSTMSNYGVNVIVMR